MAGPEDIIREEVLGLSAYPVPSAAGLIKLDAMENPYRLPESLQREIAEAVATAELNRYPDPTAPLLKARLRQVMGIPDSFDVMLGNGSDEIISIVIQAAARPGAVVIAPGPTFVMYKVSSLMARARYESVALNDDFSLNLPRFLDAIDRHRPAVVFISHPNNPTGNLFAYGDIEEIISRAPGLVVLDEAYHVFAGSTFMNRLAEFPNLMVMRTVSKLGLAGLRLGYAAAAPRWMREFDKVRPPYNVGVITQLIAERVLARHDLLEEQAASIRAERARLQQWLAGTPGVTAYPSEANFVLVRVPDSARVFDSIKRQGVLVKDMQGSHPLLANCVRFTIGTPYENECLFTALRVALQEL
ncbi:MAG: histidinol-phosphate transaminase [Betaproteobacteria bacterium]|nr:histidinol-phosphate transaminase [Betaproteobacteria bacterium]